MLSEAEDEGNAHIFSWLPNGTSFRIHNRAKFIAEILPKYSHPPIKIRSFLRQLNLYCFQRVDNKRAEDYGAYSHRLFVRDDTSLCDSMTRTYSHNKETSTTSTTFTTTGDQPQWPRHFDCFGGVVSHQANYRAEEFVLPSFSLQVKQLGPTTSDEYVVQEYASGHDYAVTQHEDLSIGSTSFVIDTTSNPWCEDDGGHNTQNGDELGDGNLSYDSILAMLMSPEDALCSDESVAPSVAAGGTSVIQLWQREYPVGEEQHLLEFDSAERIFADLMQALEPTPI